MHFFFFSVKGEYLKQPSHFRQHILIILLKCASRLNCGIQTVRPFSLLFFSNSILLISTLDWNSVYPDGRVCISILHEPGEDKFNALESADERWRPILGVESVLISVISMLSDPNDDSPANIDAAVRISSPFFFSF